MAAREKARGAEEALVEQIDNLQALAKDRRDNVLGRDWFKTAKRLFELYDPTDPIYPPFAPRVDVPALQTLLLHEASDVTDINPRIYVGRTDDFSKRDEQNERALEAEWQVSRANEALLMAFVRALFDGAGFVTLRWDPFARAGIGDFIWDWIGAERVYVDPEARDDDTAQYVIIEYDKYLDELRAMFPESWQKIPTRPRKRQILDRQADGRSTLSILPGPTETLGSLGSLRTANRPAETVLTRVVYLRDRTVEPVKAVEAGELSHPGVKRMPKYPTGRHIVEANGAIIYDGQNWIGDGAFNIARLVAMPPVYGYWPPPPIRYTRTIQELAEKFLSQNYEAMVRVNRAAALIPKGSGIDPETFFLAPAAVYEYNPTSGVPTVMVPPAYPSQFLDMPPQLFALQREIQGFPPTRIGQTTSGNISAPMFEAAISQAQGLTRLRARMMERTVARMGGLLLQGMLAYFRLAREIPATYRGSFKTVQWTPPAQGEERFAKLEPASVRPLSQTTMRMLVPLLRQLNLIDTGHALKYLDIPDGEEITAALQKEMAAAALAKGKGG